MSHELSINRLGQTEMFYIGEAPWHSLGTRLDHVATSKEAREAARLDWTVETQPIYLGEGTLIPNRLATVRTDSGKMLGIVSDHYQIIQNHEMFDAMDTIVSEAAAMYHTAGALFEGRRVWALAKLPTSTIVVRDDKVDHYMLFTSSHDGTHGLIGVMTPVRVVCWNTLSAAIGNFRDQSGDRVYIRHRKGVTLPVEEARRVLGISLRYFTQAGEAYQAMAAHTIDVKALDSYFTRVFPLPDDGEDMVARGHVRDIHDVLAHLFVDGQGNQESGVRGTLWAAYNAVTEYVDHVRGTTRLGNARKGWAEGALFGLGNDMKQRALTAAVELVGR